MEKVQCDRHPEEKLRFVCVPCNTMVCRDCKFTAHEGHTTRDVDAAASEIRHKVSLEKAAVDQLLHDARQQRDTTRASAVDFDRSVDKARAEMNKKVEAVLEWAKTRHLATEIQFEDVTKLGRRELESKARDLDERITGLEELSSSMAHAVQATTCDQYVVRFDERFDERIRGKCPAASDLASSRPPVGPTLRVVNTGPGPDSCQKAIERYLGSPAVVTCVPADGCDVDDEVFQEVC